MDKEFELVTTRYLSSYLSYACDAMKSKNPKSSIIPALILAVTITKSIQFKFKIVQKVNNSQSLNIQTSVKEIKVPNWVLPTIVIFKGECDNSTGHNVSLSTLFRHYKYVISFKILDVYIKPTWVRKKNIEISELLERIGKLDSIIRVGE